MTLFFVQYFIPCKQLYMFRVKGSSCWNIFKKLIHDARTDEHKILHRCHPTLRTSYHKIIYFMTFVLYPVLWQSEPFLVCTVFNLVNVKTLRYLNAYLCE
jgi:hypothetical protein